MAEFINSYFAFFMSLFIIIFCFFFFKGFFRKKEANDYCCEKREEIRKQRHRHDESEWVTKMWQDHHDNQSNYYSASSKVRYGDD